MNREDIGLAFRLLAMGRVTHPMVEQLADALCTLLDKPQAVEPAVLTVEIAEPVRRVKKG